MNRFVSLLLAVAAVVPPMLAAQTPLPTQITQASARIQQLDLLHASALDKARAWRRLAQLQQDATLYTQSAASFANAIQLFQTAPRATPELAEAIDARGTLEMVANQLAAAQASLAQARSMRLAIDDTVGVARSDVHLANLYLAQHDYQHAQTIAQEALAAFDRDPHADTLDKSSAMIAVSLALCRQDRSRDALPILENLVALSRRTYPEDSVPVGFAFYLLGYAEQKNHDLPLADAYMKRGIEDLQTPMGWGHPIFVEALSQYATLLRETGRAADAEHIEATANQLRSHPRQPGAAGTLDLASLP